MTKKYYKMIAEAIKFVCDVGGGIDEKEDEKIKYYVGSVAFELADIFEKDNPKFNRSKFLEACGIETQDLCNCGRNAGFHEKQDNCK